MPNSRSHAGSCTMRRPVANSKYAMLSTSDPSGRTSTSSRVMVSAKPRTRALPACPYGARPISLYSPLLTVKPR